MSRPRQEVRVETGARLRLRNFGLRHEICYVATGFHGVVLQQSNSMSQHSWSGWGNFLSRRSIFGSGQSWPGKEFSVAIKYFYVAKELAKVRRKYVVTKQFYVATKLARVGKFSVTTEDF